MDQAKGIKYGRRFFMRLLGIIIAVPSLYLLWEILVFPNMVIRGKGFDAPYIEIDYGRLPLTIVAIIHASLGMLLFFCGLPRRTDNSIPDQNS